eukprot:GDKK01003505.1.p1 GENE.GDKK01003505.1~~GDKK01003505.1.p1  ORF type:complete len:707 (+),score=178.89 GDKK01003505.1:35-2122(+)
MATNISGGSSPPPSSKIPPIDDSCPARRVNGTTGLSPLKSSPQPILPTSRTLDRKRIDQENHQIFSRLNHVSATYKLDQMKKDEAERQKWLENSRKHPYVLSPSRKSPAKSSASPTTRLAPLDEEIQRLRAELNDEGSNISPRKNSAHTSPSRFTDVQLASSRPAFYGNGTDEMLPAQCVYRVQQQMANGTIFLVEFWSDSINLDIYAWPVGDKPLDNDLLIASRRSETLPKYEQSAEFDIQQRRKRAAEKRELQKKKEEEERRKAGAKDAAPTSNVDFDSLAEELNDISFLSSKAFAAVLAKWATEDKMEETVQSSPKASNPGNAKETDDEASKAADMVYGSSSPSGEQKGIQRGLLKMFRGLCQVAGLNDQSTRSWAGVSEEVFKGDDLKDGLISVLKGKCSSVVADEKLAILLGGEADEPVESVAAKVVDLYVKVAKAIKSVIDDKLSKEEEKKKMESQVSSKNVSESEFDGAPPFTACLVRGRSLVLPPHYHLKVSADSYTKLKVTCKASHAVMAQHLTFVFPKARSRRYATQENNQPKSEATASSKQDENQTHAATDTLTSTTSVNNQNHDKEAHSTTEPSASSSSNPQPNAEAPQTSPPPQQDKREEFDPDNYEPPQLAIRPDPEGPSCYQVGLEAALSDPKLRLETVSRAAASAKQKLALIEEKKKMVLDLKVQVLEKKRREEEKQKH